MLHVLYPKIALLKLCCMYIVHIHALVPYKCTFDTLLYVHRTHAVFGPDSGPNCVKPYLIVLLSQEANT